MDEKQFDAPKHEAPVNFAAPAEASPNSETPAPAADPAPTPEPAPPAASKAKRLEFDDRDRIALLPVLLCAYLFQELLRGLFAYETPALGPLIEAGLLLGLLLWYAHGKALLSKARLPLLICAGLITLSLALYAQWPLSTLNLLAAPALFFLWALCASGILGQNGRWIVLLRGLGLSCAVCWKHIDKPVRAVVSLFRRKSRTWIWVLLGAGAAFALSALLILPLLRSADGVFAAVTGGLWNRLWAGNWADCLGRGFWAVCLAFLIYSALYALRHDAPRPDWKPLDCRLPAALPITLLLLVNLIYLVFVVIQFAYLFGGAAHLEVSGLSYAEYARSGFFQLVFVALLNLSLSMLAVTLSSREGQGYLVLRILSGILLAATAVILVSAAYRMAMYIAVYGLSILRALTIWGMVLIALWLGFAAAKLIRPRLRFFPFLFRSAVIAWTVLSLCNLNGIVARYNVDRYMTGQLKDLDAYYVYSLGPAALPALEDLLETAPPEDVTEHENLQFIVSYYKDTAQSACGDWRSWNLQCALVGR